MQLIHSPSIKLRRRFQSYILISRKSSRFISLREQSFPLLRFDGVSTISKNCISPKYLFPIFSSLYPRNSNCVFYFKRGFRLESIYNFEKNSSTRENIYNLDNANRASSLFFFNRLIFGMRRGSRAASLDNANIGRGCDNNVLPDLSSTNDGKVLNSKQGSRLLATSPPTRRRNRAGVCNFINRVIHTRTYTNTRTTNLSHY